jgi:hypothetical protein
MSDTDLPIPYEITVAQNMVTDPPSEGSFSHQWQSKTVNGSWNDLSGATGPTFTTHDGVRDEDIRLVQTSQSGSKGYSNGLHVTPILDGDLALGQRPGRPIEVPNSGTDFGTFTAIGGGIGMNDVVIFYQGDDKGYYLNSRGEAEAWVDPVGGSWDQSWHSPWGGMAHTTDGKWIVRMPGNHGSAQIARSKNATFDADDRPTETIQVNLPDYPTYGTSGYYGNMGGYFSGCTGSNVKPTRFYATPFDHHRVLVIDTDRSLPSGSAQKDFIDIDTTGSSVDLINNYRKWGMGALAGNGKIYCMPHRVLTREMLIIDTNTDTAAIGPYVDEIKNPSHNYLYRGGVMGKDGCLYWLPQAAESCWKLDPDTETLTKFGVGPRLGPDGVTVGAHPTAGFGQASLYPDGHIYCKQVADSKHWLIQLNTDTLTWKRWELNRMKEQATTRIFLDLDGNLYWTASPTSLRSVDVWNRGYGRGPWPMPGVPGGFLDPRLPFFNHAYGA